MLTIRLAGGAGNQLFQYSLGRSLEANGNEVLYDISGYDTDTTRRYCLADFGLNLNLGQGGGEVIREDSLRFKSQILDLKGDCTLIGYWQSEKYFERVRDRILSEVFKDMTISTETNLFRNKILSCPQDSMSLHIRRSDNTIPHNKSIFGLLDEQGYYDKAVDYATSVFLHVRRTDYAHRDKLNFHGLLDTEYFNNATEFFSAYVSEPHFFVFSDDIPWARKNMTARNMTIVDCNPMSGYADKEGVIHKGSVGRECEDLYLMSLCRHAIIANSTFSWWAAWLHKNQNNRFVIAPKNWFHPDNKKLDSADIIPQRWIRL